MKLRQTGVLAVAAAAMSLLMISGCGKSIGGRVVDKTPAQVNVSEQSRAAALAAQGAKQSAGQPGGPGSLPPGVPRGMPMGGR